jgi:photosystem II stability/assembly factor-like uncharacterized protein
MLLFSFIVSFSIVYYSTAIGWHTGQEVDVAFGVGIGPTNKEVYAAGYSLTENKGLLYYSGDRGNTGPEKRWAFGEHLYDVAVSNDGTTLCVVGTSGIYTGVPGNSFTPTQRSTWKVMVAQEVRPLGTNGFVVVGRFTNAADGITNGVSVTTDGGVTWSTNGIGLAVHKGYMARYGSFPTSNTWYVTSGGWPYYNDGKLSDDVSVRPSARVSVYLGEADDTPLVTFMSAKNLQGIYPGAISKSTDGGKHWQKVYDSNGAYSMNQIDCFDADRCFAVGENGKLATVLSTIDGGVTWNNKMTLTGPRSIHSVRMLSATEVWVAGGQPSVGPYATKEIVGTFYHTTDGGNTWDLTAFNGYAYDMEWKDGIGYSSTFFKKHSDIWIYE